MAGFDGFDAMGCEGLLRALVDASGEAFGASLVGVYLHGSLAMGCFNPGCSDIDLMVVVNRAPTDGVKRRYMDRIVALNEMAPAKGIEMSVVLRDVCRPFVYPTPFELHFSATHLEWYRRDPDDYVRNMRGADRDLAAHFTIIRRRGLALVGPEPAEVFGEVPQADYLDSIWRDVEGAREDVRLDPVYVILNLCRVLAFARDGAVLSKREGGEWGRKNLPAQWRGLVSGALEAYNEGRSFRPDADAAVSFAGAMLDQIQALRQAQE